ncbi:MAG: M20/M25/M40 family metallo-hydrolase [Candidatus Dormibacteraeota bacterium]|uniref:M20/M25/M40 family metallo-hydrolase n=2 Tax=Candidatus Dormiibacter inghamiae TaxID=3127013 RepID=A0A934K794_9BACT|nr:M20/M25/M40 family metallo-hydrolase [Candidatus Dormibacteraeota bacterium]MBJ7606041.1 M20/M25/M40 family metallo-hydrolase [Candidatus Dormibacteraeota bacterium]
MKAEDEVLDLCRALLRFDTSNPTSNEQAAAEWVAEKLREVGLQPELLAAETGRTNVVARLPGADRQRPGLVAHSHLDVVPAVAADWRQPPFAGVIADGHLWGRGALDMKSSGAMYLATVRAYARSGRRPARDVVIAFTADEEAGSQLGMAWLVKEQPGLFQNCSEAVSEIGGFSVSLAGDRRLYPIQTAEKGGVQLVLRASGRAGHASILNPDNPIPRLCAAVARLTEAVQPLVYIDASRSFLKGVAELLGQPFDEAQPELLTRHLESLGPMVESSLRNTIQATIFNAGYKNNVVPGEAAVRLDCRVVPGYRAGVVEEIERIAGPGITVEVEMAGDGVEVPYQGRIVDAMQEALRSEDPRAVILPYCMSGGTDGRFLAQIGINSFGFSPLRLPEGFDFTGLIHSADERVPLEGLRFGARVFDRFLAVA